MAYRQEEENTPRRPGRWSQELVWNIEGRDQTHWAGGLVAASRRRKWQSQAVLGARGAGTQPQTGGTSESRHHDRGEPRISFLKIDSFI